MATIGIDNYSPYGMACTECNDLLVAPKWSAYVSKHAVRHFWSCENCGHDIEMTVNPRINAASKLSQGVEWSVVACAVLRCGILIPAKERAGSAKSVFHFDVQGSVAKSTHAGIPWLRFIRQKLGERVHFWPFDGWHVSAGRLAIAEVYPSLWSRTFACEARNPDQHDAYCIAAWLSRADRDGSLVAHLRPDLTPRERAVAQVEGWILGYGLRVNVQAILCRRRHQPRRPPLAKIRPGSPAPAMGPGTVAAACRRLKLIRSRPQTSLLGRKS